MTPFEKRSNTHISANLTQVRVGDLYIAYIMDGLCLAETTCVQESTVSRKASGTKLRSLLDSHVCAQLQKFTIDCGHKRQIKRFHSQVIQYHNVPPRTDRTLKNNTNCYLRVSLSAWSTRIRYRDTKQ